MRRTSEPKSSQALCMSVQPPEVQVCSARPLGPTSCHQSLVKSSNLLSSWERVTILSVRSRVKGFLTTHCWRDNSFLRVTWYHLRSPDTSGDCGSTLITSCMNEQTSFHWLVCLLIYFPMIWETKFKFRDCRNPELTLRNIFERIKRRHYLIIYFL